MALYYIEVNLICIVVLCIISVRSRNNTVSTSDKYFKALNLSTVLMCVSDLVAGVCRGKFFTGARAVIEISNLLYYCTMTLAGYCWLIYIAVKLEKKSFNRKKTFLWSLPLIVFSLIAVVNPYTEFLFRIDENNLYVRNTGIYFHWIITYFYLVAATVKTVYAVFKTKNKFKRQQIIPYLYFIIPPLLASLIQMLFYGVTASQVGITFSVLLVNISSITRQNDTDPLTGLNNRNGLNKYIERYLNRGVDVQLFFLMIDINNFKQINDGFGHIVGDCALIDAATVIATACDRSPKKLFSCRYGGDEFLIAGIDVEAEDIEELKANLGELLKTADHRPYRLSFSSGVASGICEDQARVEALIAKADEAMYTEKRLFKEQAAKDLNV
ncbi:MAG: diguanylate cyclase domain-containing protein [Acutalibacteraceae bacterium]